jgi:hypothetical protein
MQTAWYRPPGPPGLARKEAAFSIRAATVREFDLTHSSCFVSGHGFSRAARTPMLKALATVDSSTQRLKPDSYGHIPARLKPRPDTKPGKSKYCVARRLSRRVLIRAREPRPIQTRTLSAAASSGLRMAGRVGLSTMRSDRLLDFRNNALSDRRPRSSHVL